MEFKNKYIYTQQMFREFIKYYKYRYLHIGIIFLIISTIFCLFIANKFGLVNIKFVFSMIGMVVLLLLVNFLYTLESEILYKNSLEEEGILETEVEFTNKIVVKIGKNKKYFDYEDITSIYNLKGICILTIGKTNGIILKKNGFYLGDYADFLHFIKSKCNKVKKLGLILQEY
ncbi:YcxB family protein [Fusobacterium sp.]|uniref:YcxB family protein n=1 Tax=Fusobacterium sp. TaxID=68766 RepID=UPI002904017B|nr:YcxB family protein [Fusobacterium sp.]MDU1910473.1 YcxB family protein [Fusobacterium sp.]